MIKIDVYEAFRKMYDVAKLDGISLWITSAYRTPTYQKWLYNRSVKKKGVAQTNRDTALPGYSEHQTGLAIDVVQTRGKLLKGFEKTKQFEWLFAHSYEYGFILRYPKDKENITGYTYEPWHYRYVGTETAKKIKELNFTFDEYYEQFVNNQ
jgi:D-alanyl-D-alanine carboxypeptidase